MSALEGLFTAQLTATHRFANRLFSRFFGGVLLQMMRFEPPGNPMTIRSSFLRCASHRRIVRGVTPNLSANTESQHMQPLNPQNQINDSRCFCCQLIVSEGSFHSALGILEARFCFAIC